MDKIEKLTKELQGKIIKLAANRKGEEEIEMENIALSIKDVILSDMIYKDQKTNIQIVFTGGRSKYDIEVPEQYKDEDFGDREKFQEFLLWFEDTKKKLLDDMYKEFDKLDKGLDKVFKKYKIS